MIDKVVEHGECEFVTEIAAELPMQVICELMGVPREDRHQVYELSNRLVGFDDPDYRTSLEDGRSPRRRCSHTPSARGGAQGASARRSRERADAGRGRRRQALSELEFNSFFLLLAVAGNETTRNRDLERHARADRASRAARSRASPIPRCCRLRSRSCCAGSSPLIHFRRTATRDTEMHGTTIREGDKVVIFYPSANRDERVFVNPHTFDVRRTPNEHLALRHRRALLPRRQPRASRDPADLRGDAAPRCPTSSSTVRRAACARTSSTASRRCRCGSPEGRGATVAVPAWRRGGLSAFELALTLPSPSAMEGIT